MAITELRIGVIGAGARGAKHAAAYSACGRTKITAICDINFQQAIQCAHQYGATAFRDYKDLLSRSIVDAISICVPSRLHAEVTLDATQLGLHVLCEKPLGHSLAECDAMIESAARAKVLLACNFQSRFFPRTVWLRKKIVEGSFGNHVVVHARGWTVHLLDLVSFLIGPIERVTAEALKSNEQDAGSLVGILRSVDEHAAVVEALPVYLLKHSEFPNSLEIVGNRASAFFPIWLDDLTLHCVDKHLLKVLEEEKAELIGRNGLLAPGVPDVADFVAAVLDGKGLQVSGAEGRKSIELATAMHMAACEQRVVYLPIPRDNPAYSGRGVKISD